VSLDVMTKGTVERLQRAFEGRRVVVLGSAPLEQPFAFRPSVTGDPGDGELLVAVNGGISSSPAPALVDAWFCNSRSAAYQSWGAQRIALSNLMLSQGRGRQVGLMVFYAREDEAPAVTRQILAKQGTHWYDELALSWTERHALETASGARTAALERHALSAGVTTAAIVLLAGAAHVRLVGFSWKAGYEYSPNDKRVRDRGHVAGDKVGLRQLGARYGARLEHSLSPPRAQESPMPPQTTPPAPAKPAAAAPTKPARPRPYFVRALKPLQFGHLRRAKDEVFQIPGDHAFRKNQMEKVPNGTPVGTGKSDEQLKAEKLALAVAGRLPELQPNGADLKVAEVPPAAPGVVELEDEVLK
jgi:hypothetical protein